MIIHVGFWICLHAIVLLNRYKPWHMLVKPLLDLQKIKRCQETHVFSSRLAEPCLHLCPWVHSKSAKRENHVACLCKADRCWTYGTRLLSQQGSYGHQITSNLQGWWVPHNVQKSCLPLWVPSFQVQWRLLQLPSPSIAQLSLSWVDSNMNAVSWYLKTP